ncbi:hypothetical protein QTP88_009335 [Uroleucon formosanum]
MLLKNILIAAVFSSLKAWWSETGFWSILRASVNLGQMMTMCSIVKALLQVSHIGAGSFLIKLENQIRTYGSFGNRGNRRQIPQAQAEVNEETEIQVLAYVQINPRSSIRHVANEVGINPRKVHSILKKFKIRPYKPDLVHHLRAEDSERRLLFIAWVLVKIEDNPQFLKYVLWTDESKFTNNGVINKQNNRFWARPYFYDGTLNGRRYLDFLSNHLPPMLENVPLNIRENLFFQQDGAPAHNAIIVRQYLNDQFRNNWMGTNGSIPWPARSPDLTPLDFFLWGHLKTVVYADPPINLQHLKQKITEACSKLTKEQITAASQDEVNRRLQSCLLNNGENFEQFIRHRPAAVSIQSTSIEKTGTCVQSVCRPRSSGQLWYQVQSNIIMRSQ